MNDSKSAGVPVKYVMPGCPADKAGVKVGDLILSVNNVAVSTFQEYIDQVATRGDKFSMDILRGGRQLLHVECDISSSTKKISEQEIIDTIQQLKGK